MDRWLLCNFHIHTNMSDGSLPLHEVVGLYSQHGFDVIIDPSLGVEEIFEFVRQAEGLSIAAHPEKKNSDKEHLSKHLYDNMDIYRDMFDAWEIANQFDLQNSVGLKGCRFIANSDFCTHNSARSQMAEAFLNHLCGDRYEAYSAGTNPAGVNPYAIKVMGEIGIDISKQRSMGVEEFRDRKFDLVVTVCDSAREECPFLPWVKKRIHKSFPDPSSARGSEEEKLEVFRKVRDGIKEWIIETFCRNECLSD